MVKILAGILFGQVDRDSWLGFRFLWLWLSGRPTPATSLAAATSRLPAAVAAALLTHPGKKGLHLFAAIVRAPTALLLTHPRKKGPNLFAAIVRVAAG